jgi:hypothetical protein
MERFMSIDAGFDASQVDSDLHGPKRPFGRLPKQATDPFHRRRPERRFYRKLSRENSRSGEFVFPSRNPAAGKTEPISDRSG